MNGFITWPITPLQWISTSLSEPRYSSFSVGWRWSYIWSCLLDPMPEKQKERLRVFVCSSYDNMNITNRPIEWVQLQFFLFHILNLFRKKLICYTEKNICLFDQSVIEFFLYKFLLINTFLMKQLFDCFFLWIKEESGHVVILAVRTKVRSDRFVNQWCCTIFLLLNIL